MIASCLPYSAVTASEEVGLLTARLAIVVDQLALRPGLITTGIVHPVSPEAGKEDLFMDRNEARAVFGNK